PLAGRVPGPDPGGGRSSGRAPGVGGTARSRRVLRIRPARRLGGAVLGPAGGPGAADQGCPGAGGDGADPGRPALLPLPDLPGRRSSNRRTVPRRTASATGPPSGTGRGPSTCPSTWSSPTL